MPAASPLRRWALTPPFHPYLRDQGLEKPRRRLFSVALSVAGSISHKTPRAFLLGSTAPCGARTFLPYLKSVPAARRPVVICIANVSKIPQKNTSGLTLFLLQHAHMCHIFSRRRIIFPYICCKQIILFYKTKRPWAGECGKYDKPQLCPQP